MIPSLLRCRFARVAAASLLAPIIPLAIGAQSPPEPRALKSSAQNAPERGLADSGHRAIALTVKGGISLGSYQAGLVWALMQMLKSQQYAQAVADTSALALACKQLSSCIPVDSLRAVRSGAERAHTPLSAATGASAGNINALLAALDWCWAGRDSVAENSIFYRIWTKVGLDGLQRPSTENSIFSREPLETAWREFAATFHHRSSEARPYCDLPIGLTVTSLSPLGVRNRASGISARASRAAVVFRLTSGDESGSLQFAGPKYGHLAASDAFGLISLASDDPIGARLSLDTIQQAVFASAAFPLAWSPIKLHYFRGASLYSEHAKIDEPVKACTVRQTHQCAVADTGFFVDGGVYANQPIDLAISLDTAGAGVRIRDRRDAFRGELGRAAETVFLAAIDSVVNRTGCARPQRVTVVLDSVAQKVKSDSTPVSLPLDSIYAGVYRAALQDRIAGAKSQQCLVDSLIAPLLRYAGQQRTIASRRLPADTIVALIASETVPRGSPGPDSQKARRLSPLSDAFALVGSVAGTTSDVELSGFLGRLSQLERIDTARFAATYVKAVATTRESRLAGDAVHHFGAFLAETFRQHDFYVGAGDALWSLGRDMFCSAATSSLSRATTTQRTRAPVDTAAKSACAQEFARRVLDHGSILVVDCAGRAVMDIVVRGTANQATRPPMCSSDTERRHERLLTTLSLALNASTGADECPFGQIAGAILCDGGLLRTSREWRRNLSLQNIVNGRNRGFRGLFTHDWICADSVVLAEFGGDANACRVTLLPSQTLNRVGSEALSKLRAAQQRVGTLEEPAWIAGVLWRSADDSHGWGLRSSSSLDGAIAFVAPSSLAWEYSVRRRDSDRLAIGWRWALSIAGSKNVDAIGLMPRFQLLFRPDIAYAGAGRFSTRAGVGIGVPIKSGRQGFDVVVARTVAGGDRRERWGMTASYTPVSGLVRFGVSRVTYQNSVGFRIVSTLELSPIVGGIQRLF